MVQLWICFLVVFSTFLDYAMSEYCYERYYSYFAMDYRTRSIHCSFGCCGPSYDEYCCVSNAGIIVGIVFAGIFGIALITAIVCCFIKQKGARGRMVRPSNATTTTVVGHSAQSNVFIVPSGPAPPAYSAVGYPNPYSAYGGYPMGPSAPMPPAYSQPGAPPPAYSYDPAYPPSTATSQAGAYPPQNASQFGNGK
ncbi:protein shisa-5 [Aplysia californica]|uniref:Protein shisa-5 n=1 Tax=Aplysia californica TaxID=6500 RepID=A0ABM0JGD6_APLCA|nr:protein shisa-5 [Aplysia californica]